MTDQVTSVEQSKRMIEMGVPVEGSREAYRALKNLGAEVEYIEFPGCNHGSWNPAFNYPGFMEWIFAQRKR